MATSIYSKSYADLNSSSDDDSSSDEDDYAAESVAHRQTAAEPDEDLALISRKFTTLVSLSPSNSQLNDQDSLDINGLKAALKSDVKDYNIKAASVIRKHMCLKDIDKAAKDVMDIDIALIKMKSYLLDPNSPKDLLYQTEWAITNMCAGSTEPTQIIVSLGFIPILSNLLKHSDGAVRVQAAWALGNIAGDNEIFRNEVLKQGSLCDILKIYLGDFSRSQDKILAMEIAAWAASNMFRYKGVDWDMLSDIPGVVFHILCSTTNSQVLLECAWALQRIFKVKPADYQLFDASFCMKLVEILTYMLSNYADGSFQGGEDLSQIIAAFLKIFANFCSKDEPENVQMVVETGLPSILGQCLSIPDKSIRSESLILISNILAGTPSQVSGLITSGGNNNVVLPLLYIMAGLGVSKPTKTQRIDAFWAVHNIIVMRNMEYVGVLIGSKVIQYLHLFLQILIKCDELVLINQVIHDLNLLLSTIEQFNLTNKNNCIRITIKGTGSSSDWFTILQQIENKINDYGVDREGDGDVGVRVVEYENKNGKRKSLRLVKGLMEKLCVNEYNECILKEMEKCTGGLQGISM